MKLNDNLCVNNNIDLKNYIKKAIPFILFIYVVVVATLSLISLPQNETVVLPAHFDKIVHFCFYFGMSILILTLFWVKYKRVRVADCIKTFLVTFIFGVLIEIIQPYLGRTFDLEDIIANCCGNILGIVSIALISLRCNFFRD